ncbi:MAG: PPOX class F420-dependent oxidoreductase [Acidobacteriota bacterium]|nr:PPOX class F420-dependent oxidoreductase [Acidobacteriota bacterium]
MNEIPSSHHDLLSTSTAVLATVGSDGRPQLSAVWFLAEDGVLKVSLNTTRQKLKNLRSNPAVNLFILDQANNQRYLEVRGDAELTDDSDYQFAAKIGAKYGGADLRQWDAPGSSRVVVTIRPVRVNAVDMSGG